LNYAVALSTSHCANCGAECHEEQLHADHADLCEPCGDDLASDLAAEVDADEPAVHLVVASPALVKIIDAAQRRARELLGERFGAAS
jgi:hypothetical protein